MRWPFGSRLKHRLVSLQTLHSSLSMLSYHLPLAGVDVVAVSLSSNHGQAILQESGADRRKTGENEVRLNQRGQKDKNIQQAGFPDGHPL
jgi:hypothetical protein